MTESPEKPPATQITFVPSNVWRVGMVVLAVIALGLVLKFIINDGGSVIFTVLMSWFAAIAMAPVVNRLAQHMRRGVATILVMLVFLLFLVVFVIAFGALLVDQLGSFIGRIPDLLDQVLAWVNSTFSLTVTQEDILGYFNIDTNDLASIASKVGLNVLSFVGSLVGSIFGLFTFGLFTFYFSADMPRLERWMASLFPARSQGVVRNVWAITARKTGGYVGARVILAAINSVTTGIVFYLIGMPYWLPLALWTGVVAQFVPTIGTYIAIVLPVIVGLVSPTPWVGVAALVWGLLYQQVENLTIEPKISAKAVDVNPAVAFGAVLLGAALFGVAGAFLAVPVVAMLLSLLDIYGQRYELTGDVEDDLATDASSVPEVAEDERRDGT
jgi:predicted PurR-regulated permease PerM